MKRKNCLARIGYGVLFILLACGLAVQAQTSVFTYQGRLTDNNAAASGNYKMQFALFDGGGGQIGSTMTFDGTTNPQVTLTNGAFTVQLDFGTSPFSTGADRFVEIHVFNPATSSYVTLTPRQQITSSPYSIRTVSASAADSLSAACVGCVGDAHISAVSGAKVTGTVANATNATTAATATNNVLKSGDTMTGALILPANPAAALGAATKQYVDSGDALKLNLSGGTMSGALDMGGNKITSLAAPTNGTDAANKCTDPNSSSVGRARDAGWSESWRKQPRQSQPGERGIWPVRRDRTCVFAGAWLRSLAPAQWVMGRPGRR